MCGIVGAVNGQKTTAQLIKGLEKLEYRGYDSSGVAILHDNQISCRKAVGKLHNLASRLDGDPVDGAVGIAHTRWATHGKPTENNAHPHVFGDVAVVHNGIIENFRELREELSADGHVFTSETDTEVIPHLMAHFLAQGQSAEASLESTLGRLEGSYALAAVVKGNEDQMFVARRGSPLVAGHGDGAMYVASDGLALSPMTNKLTYLDEGDWAVVDHEGLEVRDARGASCHRTQVISNLTSDAADKNGFDHYMLKEVHEQPAVIRQTLGAYLGEGAHTPELPFQWQDLPRLSIVACGTSSYAASIAKYWFETYARLPVDVDIASEFRYRNAPMAPGGAALFVSQSGETADTLAALRHARDEGQFVISLVNVPESSMARESDAVLRTYAGPEIGVASTKAFTAQLTALACLVIDAASERGTRSEDEIAELRTAITRLPFAVEQTLEQAGRIETAALKMLDAKSAMFMGRGASFPLAMEGALKLKEISYIHAEGFGAGELKHGPIALVDDAMPAVVIAPSDELFEKTVSNVQEVRARGARVVAITDTSGADRIKEDAETVIATPDVHPFVSPVVMAVPLQLLSYYVALALGNDVDQPRNLAKSVTVE
jgi:glucosamine--fructose-6-phosphate aminotransferase (isomerizing)